eukprot:1182683-Prorocentrum_minimum.AAC.2
MVQGRQTGGGRRAQALVPIRGTVRGAGDTATGLGDRRPASESQALTFTTKCRLVPVFFFFFGGPQEMLGTETRYVRIIWTSVGK